MSLEILIILISAGFGMDALIVSSGIILLLSGLTSISGFISNRNTEATKEPEYVEHLCVRVKRQLHESSISRATPMVRPHSSRSHQQKTLTPTYENAEQAMKRAEQDKSTTTLSEAVKGQAILTEQNSREDMFHMSQTHTLRVDVNIPEEFSRGIQLGRTEADTVQ